MLDWSEATFTRQQERTKAQRLFLVLGTPVGMIRMALIRRSLAGRIL